MKRILKDLEIAKLFNDGLTGTEIAAKLGISARTVKRRKAQPEVKERLAAMRSGRQRAITNIDHEKVEEMAKEETEKQMAKVGLPAITPIMLLAKLREFMNIPPEKTGYDTSGQERALDSLWTKCGFKADAPSVEDLKDSGPDVYQAEWMRKPQ